MRDKVCLRNDMSFYIQLDNVLCTLLLSFDMLINPTDHNNLLI